MSYDSTLTFCQVAPQQWHDGKFIAVATLANNWQDLSPNKFDFEKATLAALISTNEPDARLQTSSGFQFMIVSACPNAQAAAQIFMLESSLTTQAFEDVLEAVGFYSAQCNWIHSQIKFEPHQVVRQDDPGNQFLVGQFPCRADARLMASAFTKRGHKQTYWAEPF